MARKRYPPEPKDRIGARVRWTVWKRNRRRRREGAFPKGYRGRGT